MSLQRALVDGCIIYSIILPFRSMVEYLVYFYTLISMPNPNILQISIIRLLYLLLYILFVFELAYNTLIYKNNICVSLIIPSTIEDFLRCSESFKKSVCNSIKYSYEIVLVISGIRNRNLNNYSNTLRIIKKCTKQLIIIYRKKKYNAASNRNMGYYKSHCNIITFFDIDDIMSIYRIDIIYKVFDKNKNIDVLFHPSTRYYKEMDKINLSNLYSRYLIANKYNEIKQKCIKTFNFDNRIYRCDVSNGFFITNGWPTIKRKIMDKIKFNDTLTATEDLDFISRVVRCGYKVSIFKMPLGYYIKDNKCE